LKLFLAICLSLSAIHGLRAAEQDLELLLEVRPGRGDKPMAAVWIEDGQGRFVGTLEVCSQAVKYYPELKHWRAAQNGKSTEAIDAIMGATIRWGGKRLIEIPATAGRNLLDGNHVLCVESAADKGARFGVLRIPLAKDLKAMTVEHDGYVSRAIVRLAGSTEEANEGTEPAAQKPPPITANQQH
jgi:hypothetical protein